MNIDFFKEKNIKISLKIVLVAGLLMSGCSTIVIPLYDGPKQSENQVAKIDIHSAEKVIVDGKELPRAGSELSEVFSGVIYHILPGHHTIEIETSSESLHPSGKNLILEFEAQAGWQYTLQQSDICLPTLEEGRKIYHFPKKIYIVRDISTMPISKNNMDIEFIVPSIIRDGTINIFTEKSLAKCALIEANNSKYIINGITNEGSELKFNLLDDLWIPEVRTGYYHRVDSMYFLPGHYIIKIMPKGDNIRAKPKPINLRIQAVHDYEINYITHDLGSHANTYNSQEKIVYFEWRPYVKDISTGAYLFSKETVSSFSITSDKDGRILSFGNNTEPKNLESNSLNMLQEEAAVAQFAPGLKVLNDISIFPVKLFQAVNNVLSTQSSSITAYFEVESPQPKIDLVIARYGEPSKKTNPKQLSIMTDKMTVYFFGRIGLAVKSKDSDGKIRWIVIE